MRVVLTGRWCNQYGARVACKAAFFRLVGDQIIAPSPSQPPPTTRHESTRDDSGHLQGGRKKNCGGWGFCPAPHICVWCDHRTSKLPHPAVRELDDPQMTTKSKIENRNRKNRKSKIENRKSKFRCLGVDFYISIFDF